MGTANQQPGGDYNSVVTEYGAAPTASGGAYNDPQDLPVFIGFEDVLEPIDREGQVGLTRAGRPMPRIRQRRTRRQSELETELYAKPPSEIAALQKRLWAGGFYSSGVDANEIALGDYDEQTFSAWQKAVTRAARFNAAKQDVTIDDVLDQAAGIGGDTAGRAGAARARAARQALTVELTNPEDLRAMAQRTAVSTLGRGLSPEEINHFVSSFHAAQRGAQTATGTAVQAPRSDVAAEAFVRQAAPVEASANDVVKVYGSLTRILAKRRG